MKEKDIHKLLIDDDEIDYESILSAPLVHNTNLTEPDFVPHPKPGFNRDYEKLEERYAMIKKYNNEQKEKRWNVCINYLVPALREQEYHVIIKKTHIVICGKATKKVTYFPSGDIVKVWSKSVARENAAEWIKQNLLDIQPTIATFSETMPKGMYAEYSIRYVMKDEPSYIVWATGHAKWFLEIILRMSNEDQQIIANFIKNQETIGPQQERNKQQALTILHNNKII